MLGTVPRPSTPIPARMVRAAVIVIVCGMGLRALAASPGSGEDTTRVAGKTDEEECVASPIIIATGASSYHLTSVQDGVRFDIDGDGRISSGRELFGNHTIPGESNGFQALARMALESNGGVARGSVSSDEPVYNRLLLWTDLNHNGASEPSELRPVSDVLSDIGLGYRKSERRDEYGNRFRFEGWVHYRTAPGSQPGCDWRRGRGQAPDDLRRVPRDSTLARTRTHPPSSLLRTSPDRQIARPYLPNP